LYAQCARSVPAKSAARAANAAALAARTVESAEQRTWHSQGSPPDTKVRRTAASLAFTVGLEAVPRAAVAAAMAFFTVRRLF